MKRSRSLNRLTVTTKTKTVLWSLISSSCEDTRPGDASACLNRWSHYCCWSKVEDVCLVDSSGRTVHLTMEPHSHSIWFQCFVRGGAGSQTTGRLIGQWPDSKRLLQDGGIMTGRKRGSGVCLLFSRRMHSASFPFFTPQQDPDFYCRAVGSDDFSFAWIDALVSDQLQTFILFFVFFTGGLPVQPELCLVCGRAPETCACCH